MSAPWFVVVRMPAPDGAPAPHELSEGYSSRAAAEENARVIVGLRPDVTAYVLQPVAEVRSEITVKDLSGSGKVMRGADHGAGRP